ncbi:MAG TPA: TlpA disulfide reductase family protein [Terriglobales bacterium]|nr:TlpA disulfide reductase family protein [Terriglobales bacterium]
MAMRPVSSASSAGGPCSRLVRISSFVKRLCGNSAFHIKRLIVPLTILFFACIANAQTPAAKLWNELKEKREALPSVHQEFEVSQAYKLASGDQSSKRQMILDLSHGQWREKNLWGSSTRVRIFDGKDLVYFEEGEDEFVRVKRSSKDDVSAPALYAGSDLEWKKAVEVARQPCGLSGKEQTCAILDVPLKVSSEFDPNGHGRVVTQGKQRVTISVDSGLIVFARCLKSVQRERSPYAAEITYVLNRFSYGGEADVSLFKLADGMREVKELAKWNAAKIRKQMSGKPAPELAVTDMQGRQITLASLKGKTVLLDFWTTWCVACRADGPALDKLYAKYGGQNLEIIGISDSEERAIVEKYLKEHPHAYPIVLTYENEMPRPFQIGVLPTYIVIEKDGTVGGVAEGDQGFSALRKMLKKAGLDEY